MAKSSNRTRSRTSGNNQRTSSTATPTEFNNPPMASDDFYLTPHDTQLDVAAPGVLSNDMDPDGDPLSVVTWGVPNNGNVAGNADGGFTYTPNPGFVGTDTFSYEISDTQGNMAAATVFVDVVNSPPQANDDSYVTPHDTPLNVAAPGVLANDSDPDGDPLTVVGWGMPANGTVNGMANGGFTYTPNPGFSGIDSFTYDVSDGPATSTATVFVEVRNTPPLANDDSFTTEHDTQLDVAAPGVLANDSDPDGDPLSVTNWGTPNNGTVGGMADGRFSYMPNPGFVGVDTFTYEISDGTTETASATVFIDVQNIPPTANNDSYVVQHDTLLSVAAPGVLANDSDPNGDPLSVVSWGMPNNGTLAGMPDGSFTYSPNPGFVGVDTFSYDVSDGTTAIASATVIINVRNQAPQANDDTFVAQHDMPLNVGAPGVLSNDTDPDGDPLSVIGWGMPNNGTVMGFPDGGFTYTPNPGFVGVDSFSYDITDGTTAMASATVFINVQNNPPTANDDTYFVPMDFPYMEPAPGVLSNDVDPDGDPLSVISWGTPNNGSLIGMPDGGFTYTPAPGFVGVDTFTYEISDGTTATSTATVFINVS